MTHLGSEWIRWTLIFHDTAAARVFSYGHGRISMQPETRNAMSKPESCKRRRPRSMVTARTGSTRNFVAVVSYDYVFVCSAPAGRLPKHWTRWETENVYQVNNVTSETQRQMCFVHIRRIYKSIQRRCGEGVDNRYNWWVNVSTCCVRFVVEKSAMDKVVKGWLLLRPQQQHSTVPKGISYQKVATKAENVVVKMS